MSELQSIQLPPQTANYNLRNARKNHSLTQQNASITQTIARDHFYRENQLLKQASQFSSIHADMGPLNNVFSSKQMIKNKLNQIKFPQGYERDGNELMRPQVNF